MNKSIYKLAVLGFFGLGINAFAQTENYEGKVGVNTQQPNATLDVVAKNNTGATIEGFKTPQLTGDALKTMTSKLTADNDGLVVFVTTAVTTADASTTAVTIPGYYRFNFTKESKGLSGDAKLYAEKSWVRLEPTGLEFVVENGKGGRRLVGADEAKHGNIGTLAVDMSYQTGATAGIAFNSNVPTPIPVLEGATGDFSFVANTDNTASGQRASAFGYRAVAKGSTSFAAGNTNLAEGNQSVVFGYQNYAKGQNAAAFGQANYVEGQRSFVSGQSNNVIGTNSVAFGREHNTSQEGTAAFGIKNTITSPHSVVFGEGSKVLTTNGSKSSVAMGTTITIENSPNSLAYGANTKITNSKNAFAGGAAAEGKPVTSITNGDSSVALGASVQVTGNGSVGLGAEVTVNGINSVAIGKEATASGNSAVAIGYGAKAKANEVAIGGTSSSVKLGKLKIETQTEEQTPTEIAADKACSENGKLSYNGTDFLGCTGNKWVKLNN